MLVLHVVHAFKGDESRCGTANIGWPTPAHNCFVKRKTRVVDALNAATVVPERLAVARSVGCAT